MAGEQAWASGFRAPKVNIHDFSMIPRADIPRSTFRMQHQHKTTIGTGTLIPVYVQEVLPGDSFHCSMTAFARLATPLFPLMDNMDLESFFFFVPNRLVWVHWKQFMGEQNNPADSISYSIPTVTSPTNGFLQNSLYDYMGVPCAGQTGAGNTLTVNALPFRCYNLIANEWFRDQNLVQSTIFGSVAQSGYGGSAVMDDGPDPSTNYGIVNTAKRHDYFTSCLPWTQKGAQGAIPLFSGNPTVKTSGTILNAISGQPINWYKANSSGTAIPASILIGTGTTAGAADYGTNAITAASGAGYIPANLYADLNTVGVGNTINSLRLAFQTQRLLERDARGGTRYTEIIRSHFGVTSPDMRLQRPEYLGGGKTPIIVSAVPQTGQTGLTGGTTPLGTLGGMGTTTATHGFQGSFTEHGYILGLITVRTDEIYQQGLRKLWSRSTRYDFYFPVFAMLGEQAVLNKEIFSDGSANDNNTFGYQERWAEYRYHPSYTSSYFKSTNTTPLDAWHLATKFAVLPALNSNFIYSALPTTLQRNLALGAGSANQQLLCDFFFDERVARPMPMYSVPGLIDHF